MTPLPSNIAELQDLAKRIQEDAEAVRPKLERSSTPVVKYPHSSHRADGAANPTCRKPPKRAVRILSTSAKK